MPIKYWVWLQLKISKCFISNRVGLRTMTIASENRCQSILGTIWQEVENGRKKNHCLLKAKRNLRNGNHHLILEKLRTREGKHFQSQSHRITGWGLDHCLFSKINVPFITLHILEQRQRGSKFKKKKNFKITTHLKTKNIKSFKRVFNIKLNCKTKEFNNLKKQSSEYQKPGALFIGLAIF